MSVRPEPQRTLRTLRTCLGCRRRDVKGALIRMVRTAEGTIALDPGGAAPGRGAYVHPAGSCVETGVRPGGVSRALRGGLSVDEAARLRKEIERIAEQ